MKNLKKLISVLALVLVCGSLIAQDSINIWKVPKAERTAGHELLIAQKDFHFGATGIILGTGQILLATQLKLYHPDDKLTGRRVFTYSGLVFGLVGIIYIIESWVHIGRAGRLMIGHDKNLNLDLGPGSASLTIKF